MTAHRLIRIVATALTVAVLACLAWGVVRIIRIAGYRRDLAARGFPPVYAERLARLQYDWPDWRFEPLPVKDISWKQVVEKECSPAWNLVVYSTWAPDRWSASKAANYTPYYAKDAKAYDSGAWYQASREAIAYFLDPRNFLNESDVFMFETLGHDAHAQPLEAVERTLSATFMANAKPKGEHRRFSELIAEVGQRLGVNPVFLAGRLASEQGGGSPQARGTIGDALTLYYTNATDRIGNAVIWGKRFTRGNAATTGVMAKGSSAYNGYYNFFNFRAYGLGLFEIAYNAWAEATSKEVCARYLGPWTTPARAIEGGSIMIKERYIDTRRHTRYLQKFSVLAEAGAYRWKQYMQNIAAPLVEARNTARAYAAADTLGLPHRFLIPVYREMPDDPCPDPASGASVYSPSE